MDESTLVRHAANGDAAAWESLMVIHQEAIFRFAYLLLGDPDDAEDIAQGILPARLEISQTF